MYFEHSWKHDLKTETYVGNVWRYEVWCAASADNELCCKWSGVPARLPFNDVR